MTGLSQEPILHIEHAVLLHARHLCLLQKAFCGALYTVTALPGMLVWLLVSGNSRD